LQLTSKKSNGKGKAKAKAKATSSEDDEPKPEYWTEVLQGTPDVLSQEGKA
jgi:hypothetical protein